MSNPSTTLVRLGVKHCLFDWGNTLMADLPGMHGPMCDWPTISLVDGADRVLQALSSSYSCHLATSAADSDSSQIRQALSRAGIATPIEQIFCKATLNCDKRSANYYNGIVQRLGSSPSRIVMIGDSLSDDIMGALNCGLKAIWFNPNKLPVPAGITAITHLNDLIGN
ncbi:MAG: HAD hydrolase-like protein [Sedimenticola sp.]|nr:HAD hydrolase-like protein [Sedimenticola sp.]